MIRSFGIMLLAFASIVFGQTRSQNYKLLLQNISKDSKRQGKCGLPAFVALQQAAAKQPELAALFKRTFQRPQLPLSYVTPGGRFRIHYAVTGSNAVNPNSTQVLGVPDYIYEAGLAAQRAYNLLNVQLGFDPPMSDQNVDGPEYDFYVIDEPADRYGETAWDFLDATGRAPGYSFVDNDFTGYNTTGLAALRVTVAHEYFHGVQLNYRFRDEDIYFLEMSSTWFEDFAYDDVNDYYFYLRDFFNNPDTPLHETDGYEASVWLHYLVKRMRTSRVILDLWKGVKVDAAIRNFKTVLEASPYNVPFAQAFSEFNLWCYFTGGRADTTRYFEEGDKYPQLKFERTVTAKKDTTISDGLSSVSAHFYRVIRNPQNIQVVLQTGEPSRWMVTTISRNNQQYTLQSGGGLTPITVAASTREDTVVVAVVNTSLPLSGGQSVFSNYQLQIAPASKLETVNLLERPRPNPFRGKGLLFFPFRLEQRMTVEAAILREDGKVMRRFKLGERGAGVYATELFWDGNDDAGKRVASGVYFLRFFAGGFQETAKFVVIN